MLPAAAFLNLGVGCAMLCSGQAAALAGGTTMHIDFALPVNHDLMAGYEEWKKKAAGACTDYGFHMAVTSWSPKVASDMEQLVKHGINSFKFFMAYKVGARVGMLVSRSAGISNKPPT